MKNYHYINMLICGPFKLLWYLNLKNLFDTFHHKLEQVWLRTFFCILFFVSIPSPRWLHYDAYDYAAWHTLVVYFNDIKSNINGIPSYVIFYPKFIIQKFRIYKMCHKEKISKSYDHSIFYNKFQFGLIIEA